MKKHKNLFRLLPKKPYHKNKKTRLVRDASSRFVGLKFVVIQISMALLLINFWRLTRIHILFPLFFFVLFEVIMWYALQKKQKKLADIVDEELPSVLETMSRVYRIHPDLKDAVVEAWMNLPKGPVKNVLNDVIKLTNFGHSVEEALTEVNKTIKSRDVAFVTSAIKINLPAGGNLSEHFEGTARLLRARREVSQEVKNAMFQNKVSSVFTALFVPIIIILVFAVNRESYHQVLQKETGRLIFVSCLVWWIFGIIIMRRLMKVTI